MQNQKRVVIESVKPQINCGEIPIKRVEYEYVNVNADVLVDGHDLIAVAVLFKHENDQKWQEVAMDSLDNDAWHARFCVKRQGYYLYKVQAWVDYALNWQKGIACKMADSQSVSIELLEGVAYVKAISAKATKAEKEYLKKVAKVFSDSKKYEEAITIAKSDKLQSLFRKYPKKQFANNSKTFMVYVDRSKARFSTWYEFFPRSASSKKNTHGTFKDCEKLLPRVAKMGFDTLYFPPVHPIGEVNRKGKNNDTEAQSDDVGSAWGIGSKYGGHKEINPSLGSTEDFKRLIKKAKKLGIEIAMDYALQAAPDHPWVKEHPQWFKWRPDGTVQYAENPPKKYQDILPIYFESKDYKALWEECLGILCYWIDCGIRVFRVDNPHTKPFYFWHWIISEVKKKHPDVIFLAEAFTRPKIMQQLAKQGFSQSYTYFTWRESKQELTDYIEELTQTELREYMRPNFWPNTPDINPFHLQGATQSKYIQRYVLAATLSSNTGIYGPVFEHMISAALEGKEEYLNSEKFQVCNYNWSQENKLTHIITQVNKIRHQNEALQQTNNVKFCTVDNDNLIAFYKWDDAKKNELLIVVNLEGFNKQEGSLQLPLYELGIAEGQQLFLNDLMTNNSYVWNKEWNYVALDPALPFHIFKLKK
ncbi:MAG: alpha-1,4-glucan--maltose-1-phosphate maltosyltransferase [Flavobacteriaceae bacterium]|nr:alpha-1,4-glucan--maltose-1-phosphate maltosyltransferase [Flavobacteriaceae bacterium]